MSGVPFPAYSSYATVLRHCPCFMRQRHHALRSYSLPSHCSTARWRMRISSQHHAKKDFSHLCATQPAKSTTSKPAACPHVRNAAWRDVPAAITARIRSRIRIVPDPSGVQGITLDAPDRSHSTHHALTPVHPHEDAPLSPSLVSLPRPPRAHPRRGGCRLRWAALHAPSRLCLAPSARCPRRARWTAGGGFAGR
jgi:hypothetical protein